VKRMRALIAFSVGTVSCMLAVAPGFAQERPAAPTADPKACAQEQRLQPGEQAPRAPNQSGETLSEKLARSDGVLCPPEVDGAIRAPTPEGGRTPVVPPPGAPGGNESVRPK
jgi:hypothetical protein